jgi:proteasome accessory factor B
MSSDSPAQRILSLMAILLDARFPLTLQQVQERMGGDYGEPVDPDDPDPSRRQAFEAARRKFLRDKEALADMGVVVRYTQDDEGDAPGYWLRPEDVRMPEVRLQPDAVRLLRNAARMVADVDGFPLAHDLELALAKLDAAMAGVDLQGGAADDDLALSFQYQHRRVVPGRDGDRTLAALADAVVTRRRVRLDYRAVGAAATVREVDPYALFLRRGVWYLVGWCRLRDGIRVFDVHRMISATPVGRPGAVVVPADFDLSRWRDREPWELDVHPPVPVLLRLDRSVAGLSRSRFPKSRHVSVEADGSLVLAVDVSNRDALIGLVMSLWGRARILAPEDLVAAFADRVRALHRAHATEVSPR